MLEIDSTDLIKIRSRVGVSAGLLEVAAVVRLPRLRHQLLQPEEPARRRRIFGSGGVHRGDFNRCLHPVRPDRLREILSRD